MLYNGKVNQPLISRKLSPKAFALSLTGLTLAALVFIAVLYLMINPPAKQFYGIDGSPVTLAPVSFVLNVSSPNDHALVFNSSLLLQGSTSPGSTVIASHNSSDEVIKVNSKGDFSATVALEPGINLMTITAFDQAGNSKTENRTVFYSKEKL